MKAIQFDFFNIGGIRKMYAIPPTSIRRIWQEYNKGLTYLSLLRRQDIIDLYIVEDSAEFTEDEKLTPAGPQYAIEIPGIIPKNHLPNQKTLIDLDFGRWCVLFQDNNDIVRLAGNEENQLRFERKSKTGTLQTRNQIEFSFLGMLSEPCYFIDLDMIENI